jgi:hypothetical protein
MAKGFGIAALVIAVIAIFVPIPAWLFLAWLALLLAALGALAGDRTFAVAVPLLVAANTILMSPLTLAWLTNAPDAGPLGIIHIIATLVPFVAIGLNATGKVVLDSNSVH